MNTPSTSTNVITGIFATIFSIFFVLTIILASITWGLSVSVTPEGITDLITSDSFSQTILESEDMDDFFENSEVPEDVIEDMLDSKFAHDVVSTVTEGIAHEVLDNDKYAKYDEDELKKIFMNNKDDIIDFLKSYPEAESLSDEEIDEVFNDFTDDITAEMFAIVNDAADSIKNSDDMKEVQQFISVTKALPITLSVSALVFMIICWLLRIRFTYGLLWTGVINVVAGIFSLILAVHIKISSGVIAQMEDISYISPIFSSISDKAIPFSLIPFVFGIILIVGRIFILKSKAKNTEVM